MRVDVADLRYTLEADAGFTAPIGRFTDAAGGDVNTHLIEMDTSTPGVREAMLLILSDAPDEPVRIVELIGEVLAGCDPCDMNCDGEVNAIDIESFLGLLFFGDTPCNTCTGDVNGDGSIDALDIEPFLECLFP